MAGAANPYIHGHHESVLRSHRWRTAENSAGYLRQLLRAGAASRAGLDRVADGRREWADAEDGWLTVPHGEILCRA